MQNGAAANKDTITVSYSPVVLCFKNVELSSDFKKITFFHQKPTEEAEVFEASGLEPKQKPTLF